MSEGQVVRKVILQYDFAPERAPLWHDCDHGRSCHVPQADRFCTDEATVLPRAWT